MCSHTPKQQSAQTRPANPGILNFHQRRKKPPFLLRPRRPEDSASCLNVHTPVLIKAEQKQPANDCKVSDSGISRFWGAPGGSASGVPALRGSALAGSALTRPCFSHAQRKSSSARKRLLQQGRVQGHAHSEDLLLRDTFQVSPEEHTRVCVCVRAHGRTSESMCVCVFRRTKRSRVTQLQARPQMSPSSTECSYDADEFTLADSGRDVCRPAVKTSSRRPKAFASLPPTPLLLLLLLLLLLGSLCKWSKLKLSPISHPQLQGSEVVLLLFLAPGFWVFSPQLSSVTLIRPLTALRSIYVSPPSSDCSSTQLAC